MVSVLFEFLPKSEIYEIFCHAITCNNHDVVKLIINYGLDPNYNIETIFCKIYNHCNYDFNVEILKTILLASKFDIKININNPNDVVVNHLERVISKHPQSKEFIEKFLLNKKLEQNLNREPKEKKKVVKI